MGDQLVIYAAGPGKAPRVCPAIVEVTALPTYDPDRVAAEADDAADADRWAWVTEVHVLHRVAIRNAPTLRDLGIRGASVAQKGHIHLSRSTFRRAERAITGPA